MKKDSAWILPIACAWLALLGGEPAAAQIQRLPDEAHAAQSIPESSSGTATNGTAAAGAVSSTNAVPVVWPAATNAPTVTNTAPTASVSLTNGIGAPVAVPTNLPPSAGEVAGPSAPVAPPLRPGAEMRAAFGGSGSARFGLQRGVNPVAPPPVPEKPAAAWKRHVELGANTARGNSDLLRLDGAIGASKETDRHSLFLKVAGRYGENDGAKDTENASGEATYQRRLTERLYAAAAANIYHDAIADLDYRAQGSLSIGRHFIRTKRTVLSAEIGPGYVDEKKGGQTEGFVAGRIAGYAEFLATPSLQLWQSVEYVPSLQDSAVFYVNAQAGLETVLLANLSLRFTVEDRYDSQPAEGKEANDLLTTTALRLAF